LAYQRHLAEAEELRSLGEAHLHAEREVLALRQELIDARVDRRSFELALHARGLARGVELLDSFRNELLKIIRGVADPRQVIVRIEEKLTEI
jgi:hypothetical protein